MWCCAEHSEGEVGLEKWLGWEKLPLILLKDSQCGSDLKPKWLETNRCLCSQWR